MSFVLFTLENMLDIFFFFSSRRRHTRWPRDWSSDVCSSDLADAGRAGDADRIRATRLRIQVADELVGERIGVLDQRDRARQRSRVPGANTLGEGLTRPVPPPGH